jgi:hypothetical protein
MGDFELGHLATDQDFLCEGALSPLCVRTHSAGMIEMLSAGKTPSGVMLPGNGSANSGPAGLGTSWRDAMASAIPAAMNDDMRPETRDNGDTPSPSAGASAGTSTGTSTVWLTYAQLAESRGISVRSAQRLVLRHRWPRRPGNDGTARVGVPAGAEKPPERHGESSPDFLMSSPVGRAKSHADPAVTPRCADAKLPHTKGKSHGRYS